MTFSYGTCEPPPGREGGCAVPLQIQIQPLCAHLGAVARAPVSKRRRVRGAPVGTIDSAPVLFTDCVQVNVYRGQHADPGLPLRALRALRSVNSVGQAIGAHDSIPAPDRRAGGDAAVPQLARAGPERLLQVSRLPAASTSS